MAIQGIIRPPPDIRVVADRTAMFVAKNGRAFESRILGSAKGKTPKFAFLQTSSPFHAYYEDRIKHFESGGDDEKKSETDESATATASTSTSTSTKTTTKKEADASKSKDNETEKASDSAASKQPPAKEKVTKQKASIMDPVAKAIFGQRSIITNHLKKEKEKRRKAAEATASEKGGANGTEQQNVPQSDNNNNNSYGSGGEKMLPLPAPPMPLDTVHVVAPYHLTPTQIETIQLVAQFVALDGKGGSFLPALVSREWSNPDFGFCQPRNIHFSYFSALVDAYRKIISDFITVATAAAAANTTISSTINNNNNNTTPVTKIEEGGKADAQAQTPSEPPKPVYDAQAALNDAAYRTEYERELERRRQKHQENSNAAIEDGEIANAIDWHDFVVVETIDFPVEEEVDVGLSMLPTKTATTTATTPTSSTAVNAATAGGAEAASGSTDVDMEESSDDDDTDSNIRVVPSYTPRVVGTYDPSTARAVDPITGKSVSVADMPEHMRIQLLDPKWAEERKKFQDKQKDSNLVGGDAVVANIAWMNQKAAAAATATTEASASLGGNTNTASRNLGGASRQASSVVGVPMAPVVGPARIGQQQQQHSGVRGAPSSGGAETEQPPIKRQRTSADLPPPLQQHKHKVTIAPPLVTHPQSAANSNISSNSGSVAADAPITIPAIKEPTAQSTTDALSVDAEAAASAAPPAEEKKELLPADEFIATLGENPVVELQIRVPNDATSQNWNFFGQTVTLADINPASSVKDIKEVLSKQHLNSMPVNKIQLKSIDAGKFLSNNTTLAALNIGPTGVLELKSKQRGGRK